MTELVQMHQILGISDEREEEIAKEVIFTLTEAGRVDAGTQEADGNLPPRSPAGRDAPDAGDQSEQDRLGETASRHRQAERSHELMRPKLLDLFCGAGGAAAGYHRAGFDVTGVDIVDQPNYPFRFVQTDALTAMFISSYDAIHASPPCQNYCWSTTKPRAAGKIYPDLLEPVRARLIDAGVPYVIENVPTAPLNNPTYLEGTMFGLNVIRRRGFETNWWLPQPRFRRRKKPIKRPHKITGEIIQKSAYCSVAGNGADGWSCKVADWRVAMGIDWMTRGEIKEAIPPAYTEWVGRHLMGEL